MATDRSSARDAGTHAQRSKQGKQTLAAILAAAGELASIEGLEQLSMRRLSSAVGMSKSGLYAHFASKEELQLATIEHAWDAFDAHVLGNCPADSVDGLGGLLERWLDFFEREVFPGGCFMIISAVEFAQRSGPVPQALAAAVDREIAVLETTVARAMETGDLDADADAPLTAFELHCILTNTHALFQIRRDRAVFDRARASIQRIVGGN